MPDEQRKQLEARLNELVNVEKVCNSQRKELLAHESNLLDALVDPNVDQIPKHLWSNPDHKPSHSIVAALFEVATNVVKLNEIKERIDSEKLMVKVAIKALDSKPKKD